MPKAPSSFSKQRGGRASGSNGGPSSSSSSGGPKFSSAAPSRNSQGSLTSQMRQDDLASRFGSVSQPGRRNKNKHGNRYEDVEQDDEDAAAAGPSSQPFVTGGKAGGAPRGDKYVDKKLSGKILRLAREQQEEIEEEEERAAGLQEMPSSHRGDGIMPEDDEGEQGGMASDDGELEDDEGEEEFEYEDVEVDPEEAELLERMRADRVEEEGGRRTLADLIMDKIEAAGGNGDEGEKEDDGMVMGMNPKIVEVYTKVGELLSRYKSGPLPKAFKILPSLPHWEIVLSLTSPQTWTPHATLAATRIFVSNLKAAQSQRFFELVLGPRFRDEVELKKKASYQIYESLAKALYKPSAFFKGILFPICESGTMTLKEAAVLSSVLTKVSVPMLHSAAALLRLAEMEYSGCTSLIIRTLLAKAYGLPWKVIDALVFHFLRFADPSKGVEKVKDGSGARRMPVLWHQSLLVFCQLYKQDLTPDQKTALLDLIRVQKHPGIEPDIRRELSTGTARGEMLEEPVDDADSDYAMSG